MVKNEITRLLISVDVVEYIRFFYESIWKKIN